MKVRISLTKEDIEKGLTRLKQERPELFEQKKITGNTRNAFLREQLQTTAKVTGTKVDVGPMSVERAAQYLGTTPEQVERLRAALGWKPTPRGLIRRKDVVDYREQADATARHFRTWNGEKIVYVDLGPNEFGVKGDPNRR